nr:hypothetical protein Itr_chr06CG01470 [Ipomoea trifida]GMD08740.1 hypothetical protein Iba_chr06dCG1420 [Ipomoea batatas]
MVEAKLHVQWAPPHWAFKASPTHLPRIFRRQLFTAAFAVMHDVSHVNHVTDSESNLPPLKATTETYS